MSSDLWDQLAETHVPEPPEHFESQVHRRLNKTLLAMHLADLLFKGMLFAIGHFAQAVVHLAAVTFTGKLHAGLPRRNRPPEDSSM